MSTKKVEVLTGINGNMGAFLNDIYEELKDCEFEDSFALQDAIEELLSKRVYDYVHFESKEIITDK